MHILTFSSVAFLSLINVSLVKQNEKDNIREYFIFFLGLPSPSFNFSLPFLPMSSLDSDPSQLQSFKEVNCKPPVRMLRIRDARDYWGSRSKRSRMSLQTVT